MKNPRRVRGFFYAPGRAGGVTGPVFIYINLLQKIFKSHIINVS